MKLYLLPISAIFVFTLISGSCCHKCCKKSSATKSADAGKTKEMVTDQGFLAPSGQPAYTIESATLQDSTLSISVNYTTGKEPHDFDIVFNGMYAKSLPPIAGLYLRDNSEKDNGDKKMNESLKFNIAKIKYPKTQTVYLNVFNFKERLTYNY